MSYAIDANYHKGCNDIRKGRRTVVNGTERVTVGTLRTHKDGQGFREMQSGDCPTIPARAREDGSGQPIISVTRAAIKYPDRNGKKVDGDHSFTVSTVNTGGVAIDTRIRRLTPVECARLQGYEDDWADFGLFQNKQGEWNVREISDTGKYQVFGNTVTTTVIQAIITRMLDAGCLHGTSRPNLPEHSTKASK